MPRSVANYSSQPLCEILNVFQRWRDVHERIVDVMIAMASLELPAYTMLEIVLSMEHITMFPYRKVANLVLKVAKSIKCNKR